MEIPFKSEFNNIYFIEICFNLSMMLYRYKSLLAKTVKCKFAIKSWRYSERILYLKVTVKVMYCRLHSSKKVFFLHIIIDMLVINFNISIMLNSV